MSTSQNTLVSLAMLKVNADTAGTDYLEYLVPFVRHLLIAIEPPINASAVQSGLAQSFGLRIPQPVVETVLRRLAKREEITAAHSIYTKSSSFEMPDISSAIDGIRYQQTEVLNHMIEFARSEHALELTANQCESALLDYLSEFSIEFLNAFASRTVLVEEINGSSERRYIVHAFAKWCQQNQPELFSWLVSLVKGYMLANALLCDDLNNLPKSFGSVRVYFDTPLMIRLLGYEGLVQQGPAEELRQQLQHWRVPLAVFEHTMAELEGVLRGAELDYDNLDCKIPVARAMRNMGKSKSDITLAKTRLREDTARLGFSIVNAPEYDSTRREQIDESKFTDILDTLVNYRDDLARKTDVKSVRSIYALRKGRRPYQLEDAIAVFVTTNAGLAKAGLDYGRFTENQREVTPVTTDFSLSNYIWLKSPMQRPDLPMLEIIASCQAANMPTDSMWEKYLAEINKLKQLGQISERDHQLLRASPVVGETLMGLTLGSEPALGERTIMQILEAAKQDLVREERHKTEEEKKSRLAAEQNLAEAKDRLAAKDERDAARIRNLEARSERYGRRVALIITVPLFLILLAVMVAASIPNIASTIGVSIRAPVKILIWAVVLW